ncbi:MAG: hypothetical protein WC300_01385 [Candidatus Omnitrophota bacterium]|jgi:hypothetical protein
MSVNSGIGIKKMINESYAAIERLKKLRALNRSPQAIGISLKIERAFDRMRQAL